MEQRMPAGYAEYEQEPGLERVVDPCWGGDKHIVTPSGESNEEKVLVARAAPPTLSTTPTAARVKRWWIFVALTALGVMLAGVVGGIVGWRVTDSRYQQLLSSTGQQGDGNGSGSNATTDSILGSSTTIRNGSAIAVTGWSYGDALSIRVFYQGPDERLRYSAYDSIFGRWSLPVVVEGTAPVSETPLAATVAWWKYKESPIPIPTVNLLFKSHSHRLACHNWRDGFPATGKPSDQLADSAVLMGGHLRLAAYWPSILYLYDAEVRELYYNFDPKAGIGKYESPSRLSSLSAAGSPLLALPSTPAHEGRELRAVYRAAGGGTLGLLDRAAGGGNASVAANAPPDFVVPEGAPMAGFASATTGTELLSTHLLWLDPGTGAVSIVIQEGGVAGPWRGPLTDPVFAGADRSSQLACVTAGSTADRGPAVPLRADPGINRCYFQVGGGALKEVLFDGREWTQLGFVNMP